MNIVADMTYRERVQRVINFIEDHQHQDLSMGELASVACWSPYHFMRTFHAMTGWTVAD